jgi:hypothetical protein
MSQPLLVQVDQPCEVCGAPASSYDALQVQGRFFSRSFSSVISAEPNTVLPVAVHIRCLSSWVSILKRAAFA